MLYFYHVRVSIRDKKLWPKKYRFDKLKKRKCQDSALETIMVFLIGLKKGKCQDLALKTIDGLLDIFIGG